MLVSQRTFVQDFFFFAKNTIFYQKKKISCTKVRFAHLPLESMDKKENTNLAHCDVWRVHVEKSYVYLICPQSHHRWVQDLDRTIKNWCFMK